MNTLEHADHEVVRASAREGPRLLRWALAFVFVWFGALKLLSERGPAEDLAGKTVHRMSGGRISEPRGIIAVGLLECAVGLALLSGRMLRVTLAMMALHLLGASSPLVLFPRRCFRRPWAPTLEGHYIIKNIVLVTAGFELVSRGRRSRSGPRSPSGRGMG